MANKHNSSTVYPFVEGSNVRQGSGFSSLPSIVSSPTCSVQSMVTNISSQPDQLSYEVLVDDYPAPTLQGEILDDFTKWFVEASYTPIAHIRFISELSC